MDFVRPLLTRFVMLTVVLTGVTTFRTAFCGEANRAEPRPADGEKADAKPVPLGRYLALNGLVDDVVFGRVKNAALTLNNQAQNQRRKAILILEINPGSSAFHQVYGLAKFLTSSDLSSVKTVAWIPQTVTGTNVIVALACDEIVMHPDADLGDLGHGKALDRDEQQDVLRLVEKRHNPRLSPALALE